VVNKNPFWFGRTIFVSNHPGSFMDPLIIAALRRPIVFFMTRSDVFNRFTKPIFWLSHMLPIYRQRDNVNTKEKNAVIFQKTNAILKGN
jgi:1-acyl-sn-glycerol-3-phosphate acyltransferase